jgi:hypothetical protein
VKFQKPVIVYNYPKGIKAFYMRLNDDSKTVAAMDVLVPKVRFLIIHVYSLLSMCSDFSFHFFEYEQIDICLIFQVGELGEARGRSVWRLFSKGLRTFCAC